MNTSAEYEITRRVTLVGGFIDLVLAIAKILVGVLAYSQALIADGIHSLSDLATDFMVILAARHASADADEDHPYGHDRIETVASVVLAILLGLVAAGICWDSLERLLSSQTQPVPGALALVVATISALLKEGVFHYTMRAARAIKSGLLKANAWHSRSDALSSLVVMAGIGGALMGFAWADAIAAIAVSFMILQVAWSIGKDGISELIDTGLDAEERRKIHESVLSIDGVRDMHELRTRSMGSAVFADLHIHVPSAVSVSEGHRIGDEVFLQLKRNFDYFTDIVVHVDCEDDTEFRPSAGLPLRHLIEPRVQQIVAGTFGANDVFRRLTIHYLGGKLHLELWLDKSATGGTLAEGKTNSLREALCGIDDVGSVTLLTELQPGKHTKMTSPRIL